MKNKNKLFIAPMVMASLLFGIGGNIALAEENANPSTSGVESNIKTDVKSRADLKDLRDSNMKERQDKRNSVGETRKDFKTDMKEIRSDTKGEIKDMRGEFRQKAEEARQANKAAFEKLQLDLKTKVDAGEITQAEARIQFEAQVKIQREQAKKDMEAAREEFKNAAKEKKGDMKATFDLKKSTLLRAIQTKRDIFKQDIDAKTEEAKSKIEANKEEFKKHLDKIKDEKKKTTVENIAERIQNVNLKTTNRLSVNINRIESVLVSIESRTDKAQANTVNVAEVRVAIVNAETAITAARNAISFQAGKTYAITVTDEASLQTGVASVIATFKADIKLAENSVKAAKEAVAKASDLLKSIPNVDNLEISANVSADVEAESTNENNQ